jgi:hypothetical protein
MVSTGSFSRFLDSWWFILIVVNAVLGLITFELVWRKTVRYRKPIKELNDLFPAFRRDDALHWKKWLLYPGAVTVMIPRALIMGVLFGTAGVICKLLTLCTDPNKPLSRFRKGLVRCTLYVLFRIITLFAFFTWHTYRYLDESEVDYSEYLGTNEQ